MGVRIDWTTELGQLAAIEVTRDDLAGELAGYSDALSRAYNEPANAALMGHAEAMSPAEVVESYADLIEDGGRPFLLVHDGELAGDADLRHFHDGGAEIAFMIGAPAAQGKGLGTRYALMVNAFGFREIGLRAIYASLVPHNAGSRRVFEKLGYHADDSPLARGFADEPGDVVMSIDRETFERAHAAQLAQITIRSSGAETAS